MPVCGRLPEGGEAGLIRGGLVSAASSYQSHEIVTWTEPNAGFKPAAMNDEPKTPPGEALALARFALIAKIQDLLRQGFPLSLALEQVSICPVTLPDGSQRLFAGALGCSAQSPLPPLEGTGSDAAFPQHGLPLSARA